MCITPNPVRGERGSTDYLYRGVSASQHTACTSRDSEGVEYASPRMQFVAKKNHLKSRWFRYYNVFRLKTFRLHIVCIFTFVQRLEGVFSCWFFSLATTVFRSVIATVEVVVSSPVATISAVVSWRTAVAVIAFTFLTFSSWRSFEKYFTGKFHFLTVIITHEFHFHHIALVVRNFVKSCPLDFGDVKQTFSAFRNCYERTEIHYFHYSTVVNFAYSRHESNFVNGCNGRVDILSAYAGDFNSTDLTDFFNRNDGLEIFLHLLNDFSARSDNATDEFFRNLEYFHFRSVRFNVNSRCIQ